MIGITTNEGTLPYLDTNEHENNGLQCITDKPDCCRVGRIGEWYFPDRTRVPILGYASNRATTFFRNRGDNDNSVNLNRVSSDVMSPTGQFCCMVPDSTNTDQTVCANISEFLSKCLITMFSPSILYVIILAVVRVTIVSIPPATSIGENFTLQCSAEGVGDFLTRIKWLNIEHTDGINIESDGSSIQLQFIPLQTSHHGVYTCQATIQVGDTVFNESNTRYVESKLLLCMYRYR